MRACESQESQQQLHGQANNATRTLLDREFELERDRVNAVCVPKTQPLHEEDNEARRPQTERSRHERDIGLKAGKQQINRQVRTLCPSRPQRGRQRKRGTSTAA